MTVPLTAYPTPFSSERVVLEMPHGLTLEEMIERAIEEPWRRDHAVAMLDGQVIPKPWLSRVRPKTGKHVDVVVVPRGGGGSGSGSSGNKNTWAVVLTVVVALAATAASLYVGGAAGYPLWIKAGVMIAISVASTAAGMGINALLPPPKPA